MRAETGKPPSFFNFFFLSFLKKLTPLSSIAAVLESFQPLYLFSFHFGSLMIIIRPELFSAGVLWMGYECVDNVCYAGCHWLQVALFIYLIVLCMNAIFYVHYDMKRVVKHCFRPPPSIMPLIVVHLHTYITHIYKYEYMYMYTHIYMHLKNCILANFFRYVFQFKVSSNASNLPLEPSFFFFLQLHLSLNLLSILIYQALQISSRES